MCRDVLVLQHHTCLQSSSFQHVVRGNWCCHFLRLHLTCLSALCFRSFWTCVSFSYTDATYKPFRDALPDKPSFATPDDIKSKWSMVVCDGLSYKRWRAYWTEIMDLQENMAPTRHYHLCQEILKADEHTASVLAIYT